MPSGDNLAVVDQVNDLIAGEQPAPVDDEPKREGEAETVEQQPLPEADPGVAAEADQPEGDTPDDEQPEGDAGDEDKPVTFKELAESMGVEPKELYGVEFPLGNGESVTLGDMKDAYKAHQTLVAEREDYEAKKLQSEQEMMVANRQLQQLMTLGVKSGTVTQELLETANAVHQETMRRENALLTRAIPEWQDPQVRSADWQAMVDHVEGYGKSEAWLKSIGDHVSLKILHDAVKYQNRVKAAANGQRKQPTRQVKAKSAKPHSTESLRAKLDAVKATNNVDQQAIATQQLIEGTF